MKRALFKIDLSWSFMYKCKSCTLWSAMEHSSVKMALPDKLPQRMGLPALNLWGSQHIHTQSACKFNLVYISSQFRLRLIAELNNAQLYAPFILIKTGWHLCTKKWMGHRRGFKWANYPLSLTTGIFSTSPDNSDLVKL